MDWLKTTARQETFKSWDFICFILEVWRYVSVATLKKYALIMKTIKHIKDEPSDAWWYFTDDDSQKKS